MSLVNQIDDDLKTALKSGETAKVSTLRMVKSAVKNAEIAARAELSDEQTLAVLEREAKQRREAIAEYEKAGRAEAKAAETAELAVIEAYLPEKLSAEQIREVVVATLSTLESPDFGLAMSAVMKELKGKADGSLVSEVLRAELNRGK